MASGSLCFPTRLAAAAPRRLHRTTSLRRRATILTTKLLTVEASSEPRKKERKLLQVPGGSAPRELADLARLRQSLRTKMSPPLALTWSWAIFFLRKTRESQSRGGRTYYSALYILLTSKRWPEYTTKLATASDHGEKFSSSFCYLCAGTSLK